MLAWNAQSPGVNVGYHINEAWQHMPIIPALRKWRQEDEESNIVSNYIVTLKSARNIRYPVSNRNQNALTSLTQGGLGRAQVLKVSIRD